MRKGGIGEVTVTRRKMVRGKMREGGEAGMYAGDVAEETKGEEIRVDGSLGVEKGGSVRKDGGRRKHRESGIGTWRK